MNKKTKELEKKTERELKKLLAEKREVLREFRFGMKGSRTRDTQLGSNVKKDIARILTRLQEGVAVTDESK